MNPTAKNQVVKSVSQPVADEAKVVKKVGRKFRAPGGASRKPVALADIPGFGGRRKDEDRCLTDAEACSIPDELL